MRYLAAYQQQTGDLDALALPEGETPVPTVVASASLPASFTRFFGRAEELTRLQEWLSPLSLLASRPRLVTVTGAGGTGKTRLSLELARRLVEAYSGSVWFVSLADLRDSRLIGSSLVEALSLSCSANTEPLEQTIAFLKSLGHPALLVLDKGDPGTDADYPALEVQQPIKKPRNREQNVLERAYNYMLSVQPMPVEHHCARLKKWDCLAQLWRGRPHDQEDFFCVVAGLLNFQQSGQRQRAG